VVAPVNIVWDETPVSEGGKVTIRAYDPYAEDHIWTAKDSNGVEYTGAEVTSEGFHIFGLDPYRYYSAGYSSYLSDVSGQQDTWDIWDNNMPVTNLKNSNIVGFKYFGFGGLAEHTKGLKPFEGTKPGNETKFNVFLTPRTAKSFKVNVWLDGPWANDTWKGTKIGEIVVPAGSAQETAQFTIDVSKAVDNLDKKHAIYLVAEGADGEALYDLIGIGFSSKNKPIVRPIAPTVSISVNGNAIELPAIPVRSTNQNGIVSYDLYEAKAQLPAGGSVPTVSASASDPAVKITVTQAKSASEPAIVKFDYKGVVKTYNVLFQ
jgi:hypothetical protein